MFYNHTCGESSAIITQLFIISFTAYPTRTPNFSSAQQTINLQTGDNVVVPCEVRVSATGNFEVEWRRITFNGDLSVLTNVTLDSNYGLILKNLDISDTGMFIIILQNQRNLDHPYIESTTVLTDNKYLYPVNRHYDSEYIYHKDYISVIEVCVHS